MSVLTQAANSYQFYATNNPILTNSVTGFLIASIGDVLCQKALNSWEKKREREKQLSQLQPTGTTQGQGVGLGQKEFNYFDAQIALQVNLNSTEFRSDSRTRSEVF